MKFEKAQRILQDHSEILNEKGVKSLAIFGSLSRGTNTQISDVDLLIDYESKRGLFEFVGIKEYLEEILECDVDLVTKQALHPALKQSILKDAKNVF